MTQSLFTSQTPVNGNQSDGAPGITTGTTVRFTADGQILGVRFWATTTVSGTYTGAVYQVTDAAVGGTGTPLESKVADLPPSPDGWNTILFDDPVTITIGALYRSALHSSAGRYVNSPAVFVDPIANEDIVADSNGDTSGGLGALAQGTFIVDVDPQFPNLWFNSSNYFVDVIFLPAGAGVDLAAAITLPPLQSATVLAAGSAVLAAITLPALQAAATLAAQGMLSAALTLPALQASAVLAAQDMLTAALTLPALDMSAVLAIPVEPAEDTSSPSAPISTASRPIVIATISGERAIITGTRGGS